MNAPDTLRTTAAEVASHETQAVSGYNFAYLDEQTKRMLRRAQRRRKSRCRACSRCSTRKA